ncbi:uncharacterized protein LOC111633231 isoform X2 [Centruroides sculpturatus]|uniref:uncharacterized protein LOC111633231 isoform X2 n=1 Tax=Centruroides sculpturatus TaxID=218467 RepID=UPI000C6D48B3|nr:uncharacterized protein LOC111633231 isoform X2 [Centruroides sculpturatus]
MQRYQRNSYRNTWHRGYMTPYYAVPHRLLYFGCIFCFIGFGILLLIGGTIAMAESKRSYTPPKQEEDPTVENEFFKNATEEKHEEHHIAHHIVTNVNFIIGIVLLTIGGIFLISAAGLCLYAKYYVKKHNEKQNNPAATPLNQDYIQQSGTHPPPQPGSYPQEPQLSSFPLGSYPSQSATTDSYPQEDFPPSSYPPPTQQPPSSEPYPTESYPVSQRSTIVNLPPTICKEG